MESGSDREQRHYLTMNLHLAAGWQRRSGEDLEERRLPRAVPANEPKCLSALDREIDVLERREVGRSVCRAAAAQPPQGLLEALELPQAVVLAERSCGKRDGASSVLVGRERHQISSAI